MFKMIRVRRFFAIVGAMVLSLAVSAQEAPAAGETIESLSPRQVIPLWPGIAPGSENWTQIETTNGPSVNNVVNPPMTVCLPEASKANGTAVVICPGGAFRMLAMEDNGFQVAAWLNQRGITAFVLKYRLLNSRAGLGRMGGAPSKPLEFKNANANPEPDNQELANVISLATSDGNQAIRIIRKNAARWNLNPRRIGIMGFSAGGGVAIGSALGNDAGSRPDFVSTLYGPALVDVHVPKDAPPLFIAVCADHPNVAPGCLALYSVWKAAGKSAELHVYSDGRGGFSLRKQGTTSDAWIEQLYTWMLVQKVSDPLRE